MTAHPIERTFPVGPARWRLSLPAEAGASFCASAASYRLPEYIGVVAMVIAKLELGDVERQILLADVVERPDNAALQDRPETFDGLCMDRADDVVALGMVDLLMREAEFQAPIAGEVVGAKQTYFGRNRFTNEFFQRESADIIDNARHHVAPASDGANNWRLAASATARLAAFLVPMSVVVAAADVGFVNLDNPHELLELFVLQRDANAMAHRPCGFERAEAHVAPYLPSADSLLRSQHQVNDAEPLAKIDLRVLKDCPSNIRKAIGAPFAAVRAFPVPLFGWQRINALGVAARTANAVRPTMCNQVSVARIFVRERRLELANRHLMDLLRLFGADHGEAPFHLGTNLA